MSRNFTTLPMLPIFLLWPNEKNNKAYLAKIRPKLVDKQIHQNQSMQDFIINPYTYVKKVKFEFTYD